MLNTAKCKATDLTNLAAISKAKKISKNEAEKKSSFLWRSWYTILWPNKQYQSKKIYTILREYSKQTLPSAFGSWEGRNWDYASTKKINISTNLSDKTSSKLATTSLQKTSAPVKK